MYRTPLVGEIKIHKVGDVRSAGIRLYFDKITSISQEFQNCSDVQVVVYKRTSFLSRYFCDTVIFLPAFYLNVPQEASSP